MLYGSFNYTYRHCRSSLLRLVDSHNENLSGHSTDSKYLHIYKGCFHRDAKESNVSYFRGCLIYYASLLSPLDQQTFFEGGLPSG